MPLYDFKCAAGHVREHYCHTAAQSEEPRACECGEPTERQLSVGRGLTYFEEGRGRWIYNLGHEPIYITSHEQHKSEMKKAGVEWATERQVQGRGGWV